MEMDISQTISISIILCCLIQKIPQIAALLRSRSADGLDLASLALELWCFCTLPAYGYGKQYPFMTYCEDIFLSVQDIILIIIILEQRQFFSPYIFVLTTCHAVFIYLLATDLFPSEMSLFIINLLGPIVAASKIKQLRSMWSERDSGSLSAATWGMAIYCSSGRIVTTFLETGDLSLIVLYTLNASLNATVFFSIVYLRSSKKVKKN